MHLIMISIALTIAWFIRVSRFKLGRSWTERFGRAIALFLFPPFLLIITALTILCMGPQGQMFGQKVGWFSYSLAISFLGWTIVKCLQLATEGWRSVTKVRTYPLFKIGSKPCRLLEVPVLFCAQIGFWQPELAVSQELLNKLDRPHLDAVLAHELAHYYYRDTFWFFWLGCLRSCTAWLPNTNLLWQELLLLRELRADSWAAKLTDPLILAESLLLVVSDPVMPMTVFHAACSSIAPGNRLIERVEALLAQPESTHHISWQSWIWLFPAFLPLVAILFHN